jgi:CheY-like chemotaxis protein
MPHLNGMDLIDRIRAKRPQLPIVVLTGYGRESTKEKLAALPCCILLLKPFSGDDLAHALSQVMDLSRRASAAQV